MTTWFAALVRALVVALVRLYYPHIVVKGVARVPAKGPVIFVLNHPNGLLDPLLLQIAVGRPVRFLAKSTLFGNRLGRWVMETFGSLPVYRTQDGGGGARNEATFALCREALARGEWLALFPEGTSHSDPQLRPLKTGAARIALSAERQHVDKTGARLGVMIVPVGLSYEQKAIFRSRVLLEVGPPLRADEWMEGYDGDQRGTVDDLTDSIRAALDEVVLQAETRDLLEGIARVASWTADASAPTDPAARQDHARELVAAYSALRERDPARVARIVQQARDYADNLHQLGIKDPWTLELAPITVGRSLRAIVMLVTMAPFAAVGALLGWVPYRLAGRVAKTVATEEDVLGTVKLLAGALLMLLFWVAEAVTSGWLLGGAWGAVTLLAGPATGYLALRFAERAAATAEAGRHLWLRGAQFHKIRSLADRRRDLALEIATALRQIRTP